MVITGDGGDAVTGLLVLAATLVVAILLGLVWRARQGRVQQGGATSPLPVAVRAKVGGAGVTLLMLSTPACARCPQARALLGELARGNERVHHAELDLADHPDLAAELTVRSTPTTLALDGYGRELFRVVGVPRRAELLESLSAFR